MSLQFVEFILSALFAISIRHAVEIDVRVCSLHKNGRSNDRAGSPYFENAPKFYALASCLYVMLAIQTHFVIYFDFVYAVLVKIRVNLLL